MTPSKIQDHIKFTDHDHRYVNMNTGDDYQSVTTLIHKYVPKFDANRISAAVAKKRGLPQHVILKEWEDNKNAACEKGTFVHKVIEDYFEEGLVTDGFETLLEKIAADPIISLKGRSEEIAYSDECMIAGQVDRRNLIGNTLNIIDWKTNKEIKRTGFRGEKLKGALAHLDNCNFNIYSLQLSIYALLLCKMYGYNIGRLYLVWIRGQEFERIECPFLHEEARGILNRRFLMVNP